ncbi:MAG: hypothetical protein KKB90_09825 [Actinobacteria bacterium]|nr:hypothetical protein [Actinomycetota bacterium]MCG2818822.1 hypothetical protein [Actinomycetes bacterium]MBU4219242.1 hypothetical protein [Actinomycetota bacterium]MBU4359499.1 hypothetical protein [Actinomycetota bacterium]MBU4392889.1 hypothetical protein [Actinomycetota bacterium]
MSEKMLEQEAAKEWAQGEDVDLGPVPKRRMSLLTIRIDRETLNGLIQLAKREGTGPTIEARKILQEGVQARIDMPFEATVRQAMETAKRAVESILENGYSPPAITEKRQGPAKKPAVPAAKKPAVKKAPVEDAARVMAVVKANAAGIKLTEIEKKTGLARIKAARVLKGLIDSGRIKKDQSLYKPF